MVRKKIGILGGGIGGLSIGYYLAPYHDVTLFEASYRPGGWISTQSEGEFFFESGPRSFRSAAKGRHTLKLIRELGLENELAAPTPAAKNRYLLHEGNLQPVPSSLFSFFSSPLTQGQKRNIILGLFKSPESTSEESVFSFFSKRFSSEFANRFIDPLCRGIYGGNAKELCFSDCFPILLPYLKKSFFPSLFFPSFSKRESAPFFTFKEGMETLPKALARHLGELVQYRKEADRLIHQKRGIGVEFSDGTSFEGDHVISTLPLDALCRAASFPEESPIPYLSLNLLQIAYRKRLLKKEGFGYLVSSRESERVLGGIFDSSAFSIHNRCLEETRITLMTLPGKEDLDPLEFAKKILSSHLGIDEAPDYFFLKKAEKSIPQFQIGIESKKADWQHFFAQNWPHLILAGSAIAGVAINDAIYFAENLQKKEFPF